MGVYDTIMVPCPACGTLYPAQTKGAFQPLCREFSLEDAPADAMSDVNRHAPFECDCGQVFSVKYEIKVSGVHVVKEDPDAR